ncbi:hypothetical protein AXX17_ATUG01070 [Arabidopsis thaliana]|uniref:Arabidopsis retrotransposon Orf1 C-terminal domain-containing protein n=1 Tax=Arabidopsis thaliana TaxID=3702 RepID=A0A178U679_ARATH|nr:hypothetical protein AXX17_ATUG01070 [Arabidopsis thaliana]
MVSNARTSTEQPSWIKDTIWKVMVDYWEIEEAIQRSCTYSKFRMSDRGGLGPHIHLSGLKSYQQIQDEMEEELGRPVCVGEVFIKTHTKKDDGASQPRELTADECTTIFLQTIEKDSRGSLYGVGSMKGILVNGKRNQPGDSSSFMAMQEQLKEAHRKIEEEAQYNAQREAELSKEAAKQKGRLEHLSLVEKYLRQTDPAFQNFMESRSTSTTTESVSSDLPPVGLSSHEAREEGLGYITFTVYGKDYVLAIKLLRICLGFPRGIDVKPKFKKEELSDLWKAMANVLHAMEKTRLINNGEIELLDIALKDLLVYTKNKVPMKGDTNDASPSMRLMNHLCGFRKWALANKHKRTISIGAVITPILMACGVPLQSTSFAPRWIDSPHLRWALFIEHQSHEGMHILKFQHKTEMDARLLLPSQELTTITAIAAIQAVLSCSSSGATMVRENRPEEVVQEGTKFHRQGSLPMSNERRSLDQGTQRDIEQSVEHDPWAQNEQSVEQYQWVQDGQYSGMNWDAYHSINEQEPTSDN